MPEQEPVGALFARALAAKDFARIAQLMDPAIDFAALTPRRQWHASDPQSVISDVLRRWFGDEDEIESLHCLETDAFAGRERVGYRFGVRNDEGRFLIEQQAYLSTRDGRIGWMRIVCSGFRALD